MTQTIADQIQVGDVVVVPAQGPSELVSIEKKTQYGCTDTYYCFRPYDSDEASTITLPAGQLAKQGVRWPVNPGRMLEALEHLSDRRRRYVGKPHQKEKYFRQLCNSTDPAVLADCIRDLWTPDGTERSCTFMHIYDEALARLACEVAIVFQVPYQGVRGQLESIIVNRTAPEDLFGSAEKSRD